MKEALRLFESYALKLGKVASIVLVTELLSKSSDILKRSVLDLPSQAVSMVSVRSESVVY